MTGLEFLPHRGRGTMRSMVEGHSHEGTNLRQGGGCPSTSLRLVPLPVTGEEC